jgi:hypothetical protein
MSPTEKILRYRTRIPVLLLLLGLPWLSLAFLVPWWVSAAALVLLPLAAAVIIVVVFPTPGAMRRQDDTAGLSNTQIQKMREASSGLHNLLGRWSNVSRDTRASLEEAQNQVDHVIEQTESAVIEITNSFLAITRKTRTQMEYALGLLQHANVSEGETAEGAEDLSLPQYIRASETMLNALAAHLLHFSEESLKLMQRQQNSREQARRIDDLLDQMTSMSKQLGVLALNTSVIVQGKDQRFVDLADKVRALSQNANELSRDIRQSLEGIKDQMGESYSAINAMTQEARATAQKAQSEVQTLSLSMLSKNQQVADNLARINSVGAEIQKDINQIIISMQFQDITQQKLRRLKAPVLSEVLKAVHSLADETRFLNQRLNANLVDVSGIDAATPFRVVKNGATTTVDTEGQETSPVGGKQPGESDGKVELF